MIKVNIDINELIASRLLIALTRLSGSGAGGGRERQDNNEYLHNANQPLRLNTLHTIIIIVSKQEVFVNRKKELASLNKFFNSNRAEFIVIYGRRRIGKTELIKEAIKGQKAAYFFVEQALEEDNLDSFKKIVAETIDNPLIAKAELTWEELFQQIAKEDKLIIVLDEIPNLISENKALLSKFQKIWDEILKNTTIKLILCGSSISMMESYLLDRKSPLYGRRTGQLFIAPLKAVHIRDFGVLSIEDAIRVFGITDGIPEYIKEVCYRLGGGEKLVEVFQQDKMLFAEADVLIKSELRDPTRYFKILKAIAFGNTKFGEIANYTDFPAPTVSKYLSNLVKLHIVKETYPVFNDKERRRNRRYRLSDNYFNFYFRFIYPNKSEIIFTDGVSGFDEDYNRYLGRIFERVCEEFLEMNVGMLPFKFNKVGCWWFKDKEIDIVAMNESGRDILFMECKWSVLNEGETKHILELLREKSGYLKWNNNNRMEHFGIMAKKIQDKEMFREQGFLVFDLDDF